MSYEEAKRAEDKALSELRKARQDLRRAVSLAENEDRVRPTALLEEARAVFMVEEKP